MIPLRSKLIRLAHQQPALRPQLLPLLKTAALDPRAIAKEPKVIDKLTEIQSVVAPIPAIAQKWSENLRQPNRDAAALNRLKLDEYATQGNAYAFKGIQEEMAEMAIEIATIENRAAIILRTIRDLLKP